MRQFLAIPVPAALRREAVAQIGLLDLPGASWRVVREEGLHVTIRFLGEVDPARHDAWDPAWREAAGVTRPLRLRLGGAAFAPSPARPRVVWLAVHDETGDGSLARLADRVEGAARSQGFAAAARPFSAHVTLARVRRRLRARAEALPAVYDLGAFTADRLVLYRSLLGPGGAVYEELSSYAFASGASS
jgi:2'-5' RNA ligase